MSANVCSHRVLGLALVVPRALRSARQVGSESSPCESARAQPVRRLRRVHTARPPVQPREVLARRRLADAELVGRGRHRAGGDVGPQDLELAPRRPLASPSAGLPLVDRPDLRRSGDVLEHESRPAPRWVKLALPLSPRPNPRCVESRKSGYAGLAWLRRGGGVGSVHRQRAPPVRAPTRSERKEQERLQPLHSRGYSRAPRPMSTGRDADGYRCAPLSRRVGRRGTRRSGPWIRRRSDRVPRLAGTMPAIVARLGDRRAIEPRREPESDRWTAQAPSGPGMQEGTHIVSVRPARSR